MISELKDEEIMDFLMTSEFEDDYKPEELKYLLFKFRNFYRALHGRHELVKTDSAYEIKKLKEESENNTNTINRLQSTIASKEDVIHSLQNRKLTLKERFSGKIIMKDENK